MALPAINCRREYGLPMASVIRFGFALYVTLSPFTFVLIAPVIALLSGASGKFALLSKAASGCTDTVTKDFGWASKVKATRWMRHLAASRPDVFATAPNSSLARAELLAIRESFVNALWAGLEEDFLMDFRHFVSLQIDSRL